MNQQLAYEQYTHALKLGQKNHRDCVLRGSYPYPQVLDDILDGTMIAGRVDLGVIEIPAERIVGTKTAGRKNAFSANFMPLLPEDSEFATKWRCLCAAHLGDEGIRDPIRCYEYLGRFYVQEGNKRVSVLKSYDAPTIPGYVIRLLPVYSEDAEIRQYYEFLQFYQLSRLYQVSFSQSGGFSRLQAALGYEPDHVWTEEERRSFLSSFVFFESAFRKLGGETLPVTAADALLVWLGVYPFETLRQRSFNELVQSLGVVWPDVKVAGQPEPIGLSTEADEAGEKGEKKFWGRLVSAVMPSQALNIAFIHQLSPEKSTWVRAHEQGRCHLEEVMGDKITVQVYTNVGLGETAEQAMEDAIANGAQVIFATTAPLIADCRRVAARHPGVKMLNCSVSMPYTGVRTYYSRIYEGKFISGAIAGAMTKSDRIGYIASSPIFGVPAGINAFALGARLTNPRARVELRWSCLPGNAMEDLKQQGIDFISTLDIPTPDWHRGRWGACQVQEDGSTKLLASPYWNWGAFYVKLIKSILGGGWDALNSTPNGEQAVNYWWGMASGVIGVQLSDALPEGVAALVQILQKGIIDGTVTPFHRCMLDQSGNVRNDGGKYFTPEEILHMNWLSDVVDGAIPAYEELLPRSQGIVRLQGVYRDSIPPEKEGVLL